MERVWRVNPLAVGKLYSISQPGDGVMEFHIAEINRLPLRTHVTLVTLERMLIENKPIGGIAK